MALTPQPLRSMNKQFNEQAPELHELGKRVIKLAEKGQAWVLEERDKYVNKLRSIGDNLVHLLKFNPSEHYYSDDELTDIEQKLTTITSMLVTATSTSYLGIAPKKALLNSQIILQLGELMQIGSMLQNMWFLPN